MNFLFGYSPEPQGPQPLTTMGEMLLSITWDKHDVVFTSTRTNTTTSDFAIYAATAAIINMRGGRTSASVVPPMGIASGSAITKPSSNKNKPKSHVNSLNIMVINPDYHESR